MNFYFEIAVDASATQSLACQVSTGETRDTRRPAPNTKHSWQSQPSAARRAKQQQTVPRSKDWASLLHSAAVLYGAPLPKRWTNQVVALPFEQARRILTEMQTCRERYRHLKVREFRRLLWQVIEGRTETPSPRQYAQKSGCSRSVNLSMQQLSLFSSLNEHN